MHYLFLALSWAIFYTLLTALASDKLKIILKVKWPELHKNYRQVKFFLLISILILIVFQALYIPKFSLLPTGGSLSHLGFLIATLGVVAITRAWKSQSFFVSSQRNEIGNLRPNGIYLQIRHPFLLGSLLVMSGFVLVAGTLASLVHWICLVIYAPIGIILEEKKMEIYFGEAFQTYKREVPMLLPKIFGHKKRG